MKTTRRTFFGALLGWAAAKKQTFQILTKHPQNAAHLIENYLRFTNTDSLPPNIWIGVSAEDQKHADERIPWLLRIPAAVRFLSVEPMLEQINLNAALCGYEVESRHANNCDGSCYNCPVPVQIQIPTINWVIFGGESGPGARPCNIDWIRDGVSQCQSAGVPVFVKQLGSNVRATNEEINLFPEITYHDPNPDDLTWRLMLKHLKAGDPSEWPADLRVREFPNAVNL